MVDGCKKMNGEFKIRGLQRRRPSTRSGQAIAELVVGLIALLVVFMGMLQIQRLAHAHTQTLIAAREQAGQDALLSPYVLRYAAPSWIRDWSVGRDNVAYSQDDTPLSGNPNNVTDRIAAHAQRTVNPVPAELTTYAPGNELSAAATTATLQNELYLTHGQSRTNADVFSLIRSIVYRADTIQLQGNAWLTWTHIE